MRFTAAHRTRSLLALLFAIVLLQMPTVALADSLTITLMGAQVASGGQCVSPAVAGNDHTAYFFSNGGVIRYDSLRDVATDTGARVQSCTSSAVWDGAGHAYIFGGQTATGPSDVISRYDAQTNTVAVMRAKLPTPSGFGSAVWIKNFAYIFGGTLPGPCSPTGCPYTDQIVRYDPRTDTATLMNARLPSPRINMSAASDGRNAYIFGGCCTHIVPETSGWSQIVRYDPVTDTTVIMSAVLPDGRFYASAATHGSSIYIFGGEIVRGKDESSNSFLDDILRYDPAHDVLTAESVRLPSGRSHTAAVVIDNAAYIFGGLYWDHTPPYEHNLNQIVQVRFDGRAEGPGGTPEPR